MNMWHEFYVSNRKTPAIKFKTRDYRAVKNTLTSIGVKPTGYFKTSGNTSILYLVGDLNELRSKFKAELLGLPPIPSRQPHSTQPTSTTPTAPTAPAVIAVSEPTTKEIKSWFDYDLPSFEPQWTVAQLRWRIRNKPHEVARYILTAQDEWDLETVIFGDWTVEELQTFTCEDYLQMLRLYNLQQLADELSTITRIDVLMTKALPHLYKGARKFAAQCAKELAMRNAQYRYRSSQ